MRNKRDKYDKYPCKYYHYFSDYSIHECYNDLIKRQNNYLCKDPENCPYRNEELDLVRCPFCNSDQNKSSYKKSDLGFYIECVYCHSRTCEFKLKKDAVAFWNQSRRVV